MRRYIPVLLLGMIGATVALAITNYEGDAANAEVPKLAAKTEKEGSGAVAATAKAPVQPALARTLRTVSLGWEYLAPGVVATSDKPADDKKPAETGSAGKTAEKPEKTPEPVKLDTSFANAITMDEIESALAKGGAGGGADIAIMPLSSYVASYERLRALAPELIFVVGWSRGREAIYGTDAKAITKLPSSGQIKVAATATAPETFLALFLLDLAGVPASRVELVSKDVKAPLTAVYRVSKQTTKGKLLVTSADMPHMMPIVAVAPHGFIQAHATELEAWGRMWLAGVAKLQDDVPTAGRQVATLPGAPPVLSIIEALGQIEFATLRENATAMGLSGRGALTLDEIFRTTWRIWRDVGTLTTPPPEVAPLSTGVVASLVRTLPDAKTTDAPRPRTASNDAKRPEVLLVVKGPLAKAGKLDAEAFVNQIGMLAGVFDRLKLRIGIRDDAKTAELLVGMARDRFGLRPDQLAAAKQPPSGTQVAVEVLAPN